MANNFSIRDRDRAHVSKTRMDYLGENFEWIESWIRNNNFSLSLSRFPYVHARAGWTPIMATKRAGRADRAT